MNIFSTKTGEISFCAFCNAYGCKQQGTLNETRNFHDIHSSQLFEIKHNLSMSYNAIKDTNNVEKKKNLLPFLDAGLIIKLT